MTPNLPVQPTGRTAQPGDVPAVGTVAAVPATPAIESSPAAAPRPSAGDPAIGAETASGGSLRAASVQFVVEPDSDRVRMRIVDPTTQEVIREIPSEETARVARALREYAEQLARAASAAGGAR